MPESYQILESAPAPVLQNGHLPLMLLMRHERIETTQNYYIGRDAETAADVVWDAFANSFANSDEIQQKTPSHEMA